MFVNMGGYQHGKTVRLWWFVKSHEVQAASAQWFGERGLVCRIYSLHEALQIGCLLLLRFGEVVKYFDSVNVDSGNSAPSKRCRIMISFALVVCSDFWMLSGVFWNNIGGKQGWLSRYYQDFKIDFRVWPRASEMRHLKQEASCSSEQVSVMLDSFTHWSCKLFEINSLLLYCTVNISFSFCMRKYPIDEP